MTGIFEGYGGTSRSGSQRAAGGGTQRGRRPGTYLNQVRKRQTTASAQAPEDFLKDLTSTDLEAIISSPDAPESVKKLAAKVVAGKDDGKPDGGILHKLTHNPVTDSMGTILQLIDKPKRAVVATLDEGLEAAFGYEDGNSWADNVLRKADYGMGDVWRSALVNDPDGKTFGVDNEELLKNKWLGRGVGLVGDIGLDPLTYVGVGLVDDAADGAKAGAKALGLSRTELARRGVQEAATAAKAGDTARVAQLQELAQRVGQGGRVTAEEAASLGAKGGVRFAGKRIFGDAATSTAITRPFTKTRSVAMNAIGPKAAKLFGADELKAERALLRSTSTNPTEYVGALVSKDAKRAGRLGATRFGARKVVELDELLKVADAQGVDGITLNRALIGDPDAVEAVGDLLVPFRGWLDSVRSEAGIYGYVDDYSPRMLTDEARDWIDNTLGTGRPKRGRSELEGTPWFEMRRYKAGDQFGREVLGSPELVDEVGSTVVEDQIEYLIRKWGGPENIYVNDATVTLPRYIAAVQHRIRTNTITDRLRAAGVIVADSQALERATAKAEKRARRTSATATKRTLELDEIARNVDDIAADADETARVLERIDKAIDATPDAPLVAEKVARGADPEATPAMRLEAQRARWEAEMDRASGALAGGRKSQAKAATKADEATDRAVKAGMRYSDLRNHPGWQRTFQSELQQGLVRFGAPSDFESWPSWMAEAYARSGEVAENPNKFFRFVDQANRLFKTQAVFSPGFHVRNSMGAYFNGFVAGVDVASYREFRDLLRKYRTGGYDAVPSAQRELMRTIVESGLLDDGNRYANELASAADGGGRYVVGDVSTVRPQGDMAALRATALEADKPSLGTPRGIVDRVRHPLDTINDNPATRASRFAGERIEHFHRGAMAYDTLRKGGSMDQALDKVYQFHFDYNDLSTFESKYMRRLVPFWTWTSRNLPLQLEMALTQPKMYQRFRAAQAALEQGSTDNDMDPEWLRGSPTAINMSGFAQTDLGPFSVGGDGSFLLPDLPFNDVQDKTGQIAETGPMAFLQDAAPIVKTPLETTFGKRLFDGAPLTDKRNPLPDSWSFLVPILRGATGDSVISKNPKTGDWMISEKDAYKIEQALPLLARFRRLAPSEKRYQDRADASWLSFLGFGTRQVTENDRKNSAYGRLEDLQALRRRLMEDGYDVRSERTRQIEGPLE